MEKSTEKRDMNVIFLVDGTLFFHGFSVLTKYAAISSNINGMFIKPVKDLSSASLRCFELENHRSVDESLINYLTKNNGLNYNFLLHDGCYYRTHITIETKDIDYYLQFPKT